MTRDQIKQAIQDIGLALHTTNNTIATDKEDIKPDEESWRVNHTVELKALADLEKHLLNNSDICPLCGNHKSDP